MSRSQTSVHVPNGKRTHALFINSLGKPSTPMLRSYDMFAVQEIKFSPKTTNLINDIQIIGILMVT